ncbi:flavin reductase family protein [Rhizohabitans arisaemae]|uniref:flavin reductase family protein n=1 Tax=Rhizohabitans arisaemae TaxID=2720610 RepID=UPI0024B0FAC4|nr:flavin reductase family protein [Rhizohabitans arisaemae]
MSIDQSISSRDVDVKALRQALGTFSTGVTVVTTATPPHAMTANSFTSVSLDPPLVLICVRRDAIMHGCLSMTGHFGVSVLSADQEGEAKHFANRWRTLGAAQFEEGAWRPGEATGVPLLENAAAWFECELWRSYDGGDHTVFIGKVLSVHRRPDADPLLFCQGRFRRIAPQPSEVAG